MAAVDRPVRLLFVRHRSHRREDATRGVPPQPPARLGQGDGGSETGAIAVIEDHTDLFSALAAAQVRLKINGTGVDAAPITR